MTDTSARDAAGFSAPNDTIDLPSKLACEVMGLDWIRRHSADADEHCDHHGQLQELFAAALAPDPAIPGPGAGDRGGYPSRKLTEFECDLLRCAKDWIDPYEIAKKVNQSTSVCSEKAKQLHLRGLLKYGECNNTYRTTDAGCSALLQAATCPAQPAATPGASEGLQKTVWPVLKAMASNYTQRHSWHPLDAQACADGAKEIQALRAAIASGPEQGVGRAVQDVLAERREQFDAEGWAAEHDRELSQGQLARAASCYASRAALGSKCVAQGLYHPTEIDDEVSQPTPGDWPWEARWWQFESRRRALVKAGALILAEIERLDRAAPAPSHEEA